MQASVFTGLLKVICERIFQVAESKGDVVFVSSSLTQLYSVAYLTFTIVISLRN